MTDKTYDKLKWIAQLLLPALGTLYAALAALWDFPYAEAITGSIAAADTFLGALLTYRKACYDKEEKHE